MNIKKEVIIKYVVVILAVLNLIWLFGFEYRIPERKESPKTEEVASAATTTAATASAEKESANQSEEEEESDGSIGRCRVIVSPRLNIRKGPGTNYDVLTTAVYNEILTVYGAENGWVHVRNEEGIEGYVSEVYIEMLEEETE